MGKRCLIVTDSLGMPRYRDDVNTEDTWINLLLEKNNNRGGGGYTFFTFCKRSNTILDLDINKEEYINNYRPDIIVVQLGIVDCVRRALPRKALWFKVLSRVPFVSRCIRGVARRCHFFLTKFFEFRDVPLIRFKSILENFILQAKQNGVRLIFISIAPPGDFMKNKTFQVEADVEAYNHMLRESISSYDHAVFINPYREYAVQEYILPQDGHHLNPQGNQLVFQCLSKELQMI